MVGAWHGKYESDTAALCESNGKAHSKPLAARNGHGMLCVNRPLYSSVVDSVIK